MRNVLVLVVSFLFNVQPLSAAEQFPRVVYPQGHVLAVDSDAAVVVDVALLQIELSPGLYLSAPRGTRFAAGTWGNASPDQRLQVVGGDLTVLNLQSNAVAVLPPGHYRIAQGTGRSTISAIPAPDASPLASTRESISPDYRLSDVVMTQQQKYLDSLKIDVRDLNKALASIIRGLVPRRP